MNLTKQKNTKYKYKYIRPVKLYNQSVEEEEHL